MGRKLDRAGLPVSLKTYPTAEEYLCSLKNPEEALPDVCVFEILMHDSFDTGLSLIARTRKRYPDARIYVFCNPDFSIGKRALEAGADRCVFKHDGYETLINEISLSVMDR